jgi:Fe-S oxidoreductase
LKVVLFALNSSFIHTNLAVRCLYRSLSDSGIDTVVIEKNLKDNRNKVLYELYNAHADIYGFSTYIWNVDEMLSFAEDLKSLLPQIKIIFGGPEVSFEENVPLFIDHIIKGEGENVIADLCLNPANYGKIVQAERYDNFINEGILYDSVPVTQGDMLYYESSRGCPYNCSYCLSSTIKGIRMKSAQKTLDDLKQFETLPNKIKVIKFVDRTFNCDIRRAKYIWHELLGDEYMLKYHFEICADLLDEESFMILAALPKDKIQLEIGIQSTHIDTLSAINRKSDVNRALRNLERLNSFGNIHIHADLIAGLPYETYDIFKKSFNDVYGKCDMLQLGFLKLLKGTCIRSNADKWGYKFTNKAPYTILSNDFISYGELMKLKEVESVLNRFGNSGRFSKSIPYMITLSPSPFDFYEKLADFLINTPNFSQIKAYELLYSYAEAHINEVDIDMLKSFLTFDFLNNETSSCPPSIRFNMLDTTNKNTYRFKFDSDNIYLFDRQNRTYNIERFI